MPNFDKLLPPTSNVEAPKNASLRLFPNPAEDYVVVEYLIPHDYKLAVARLIDSKGSVLASMRLLVEQDQLIFPLEQESGVYQFEIVIDGNECMSKSLIVK